MKVVLWAIFTICIICILAATYYCWQNKSGHSAESPIITLYIFAPVFLIGLTARIITKGRWLSARSVEVAGLVGMVFGLFVSKIGILLQYDDWIAAGMPNRNPNTNLLLVGYVVGGLGGSLIAAYLATPKAEQAAPSNR